MAARLGKVHVLHSRCVPSSPRSSSIFRRLLRFRRPINGTCHDSSCEEATDSWILSLYKESSTHFRNATHTLTSSSSSNPPFTIFFFLHFPFSISLSSLFYYYNNFGFYLGITLLKRNLLVLILGNYREVPVVSWGTCTIYRG